MNVHLGILHVSAIDIVRGSGFMQNQGHWRNPNPYPMGKTRITVSTGIALIPDDSTTITLIATIAIRRIVLICHMCVSGSCDRRSTVQLLECGDASSLRGETTCGPHTSLYSMHDTSNPATQQIPQTQSIPSVIAHVNMICIEIPSYQYQLLLSLKDICACIRLDQGIARST